MRESHLWAGSLGSVRMKAEQTIRSKPVSSTTPWHLHQLLPSGYTRLSSCPDFLRWWTLIQKHKPSNQFPPKLLLSWCFITASVTLKHPDIVNLVAMDMPEQVSGVWCSCGHVTEWNSQIMCTFCFTFLRICSNYLNSGYTSLSSHQWGGWWWFPLPHFLAIICCEFLALQTRCGVLLCLSVLFFQHQIPRKASPSSLWGKNT